MRPADKEIPTGKPATEPVVDATPETLRATEQQMETAIAEAKKAAQQAGVAEQPDQQESLHRRLARRTGGELTTFSLELEGLTSALHVADIEDALTSIPGVRASVIYVTSTAWVTAPDDVSPDSVIEVFSRFGVDAYLTRASLRRRAERLETRDRRRRLLQHRHGRTGFRPGRLPRKRRRELVLESENDAVARQSGRLKEVNKETSGSENVEVLFTARELLTRQRLIVSAILALPVMLLSYVPALQFDYWQWLCLGLSTPVVLWGAWPFHRAAVAGLRRGMSALDAASSVAVLSAYFWSLIMLLASPAGDPDWRFKPQWLAYNYNRIEYGELFLDVACGVTVFMLFGGLFIRRTRASLLDETSQERTGNMSQVVVVRKRHSSSKPAKLSIPIQEIRVGDDILVPQGSIIPADGQVIGGSATVIPGRSFTSSAKEYRAKVNTPVFAGGTVQNGSLKIRVHRTGSQTRIASIQRWIQEASQYQNRSALLATRTASLLVPWALTIAAADFLLWWLIGGNVNAAFASSIAILAGVGPVSLALSTSLAMRLGIEQTARRGILVRNAEVIRELDDITHVIFNRVGTLAEPEMIVETIVAESGENPELVLRVAGALAMESDHPVSRALVRADREARDSGAGGEEIPHWIDVAHSRVNNLGDFEGSIEIPVKDADGNMQLRMVDALLWRPKDISALSGRLASAAVSGGVPLVVSWKGKARGVITLHDDVKDDAVEAVAELESMGLETVMLTRDMYPVARRFADNLGISSVLAGISYRKKAQVVRTAHTRGATVAVIGDISVRECLRVADVGVLVGSRGNVDVPEADVVLLRNDVSVIAEMMDLARRVSALVDRNIMLAWAYNAAVMVLAATGVLHPMAATLLMIGSSLLIEARSNLVRKF